MSLWGNNDNLESNGTVSLNYATKVVTGTGTTFGTVGFGVTGDVIRFGVRGGGGTYFGDAVIVSIASTQSVTIGSTAGLSGAAISGVQYKLSELPSSTVGDFSYSENTKNSGYDKIVYGISNNTSETFDGVDTAFRTSGAGWVGVTTYLNHDGTLRVKSEVLVAASGIQTGSQGIAYPTNE